MTEFKLKPIEGEIKATAKNQMIQRLTEMYNDQKYFDCKFVFPTEKKDGTERVVFAHKFLMAVASPVFERMFFGSFKESSKKAGGIDAITTVEIKDIEPEVFQTVLRWVRIEFHPHTNSIQLCKIERDIYFYTEIPIYLPKNLAQPNIIYDMT